jgi:hypothetical protein
LGILKGLRLHIFKQARLGEKPPNLNHKRGRYPWQVSQLVAAQVLQDELPPIGVDTPSALLEKEAKQESIRWALL